MVGKKAGKATITAKVGKKKYTCKVTIVKPISLNRKSVTLAEGESITLKLNGTEKKKKWSSSNKKAAVVSQKGKVTGKKAGKTMINVTVGGKKYTCHVTVTKSRAPEQDSEWK